MIRGRRWLSLLLGTLLAPLALAAAPATPADPTVASAVGPDADAEGCAALQALDYRDTVGAAVRFSTVTDLPAAGDQPAACRVSGRIAPAVGFEVRLPRMDWNGRLLVTGCSNLCGYLPTAGFEDALARGYAVATTDLGHSGEQSDARWALNNPAAEEDFGHRATHVTTRLAKALVTGYYGSAPDYAYFRGCSTGGRQALVAAERYPDDFDGIIAGAPFNQSLSVPHMAWVVAANTAADGTPVLREPQFEALRAAALATCDGADGLADGVIGDPEHCRFDPASLACGSSGRAACLTPAQVRAATAIYAGPRTSGGTPLAKVAGGAPVGSEFTWGQALLPEGSKPAFFDFVVQNWSRYLAYVPDPPGPGPFRFDPDRDSVRLADSEGVAGYRGDLRRFRALGGRLLLYHGWSDESLMPAHTLDYWQRVGERLGSEAARTEVARLYMLPGVLHCGGGPGAAEVDYLSALERWVEADEAPDVLIAARVKSPVPTFVRQPRFPLDTASIDFARPLYPYPDVAFYAGGPTERAESFRRASDAPAGAGAKGSPPPPPPRRGP